MTKFNVPTTLSLIAAIGSINATYTPLTAEDRDEFPDAPRPAMIHRADPVTNPRLVNALEMASDTKIDTSVLITLIIGCGEVEVIAYDRNHELVGIQLTVAAG